MEIADHLMPRLMAWTSSADDSLYGYRQTSCAGAEGACPSDPLSRRIRAGESGSGPGRAENARGDCRQGGGVR